MCSGGDADHVVADEAMGWIRKSLRGGAHIGAVADAAFFLARAGLPTHSVPAYRRFVGDGVERFAQCAKHVLAQRIDRTGRVQRQGGDAIRILSQDKSICMILHEAITLPSLRPELWHLSYRPPHPTWNAPSD